MYSPIEGGALVDVQGLKCYTPPEGYIWDYEEDKWVYDGVHKHAHNFKDCFWKIDERWNVYEEWKAEQDKRQEKEPSFAHAELHKFIADCWRWRLGGYWFYNGDAATYVTGTYWYCLSVFKYFDTDNGLPDYKDIIRTDVFYAWEWVVECDWCKGMNLIMNRRGGKTGYAACSMEEKITRTRRAHGGIQSKTLEDAKDAVFSKGIIETFRQLPYFFLPTSDMKGLKVPQKALTLKRGDMGASKDDELNSKIDFMSANVKAYDRARLVRYIMDEAGKTDEVSVYKRWLAVAPCLVDNNQKVIGKAFITTTVDEPDSGGSDYYLIWKGSKQTELNELGETQTGLINIMIPANYAGQTDKYGIADAAGAYAKIIARRALITDPYQLATYKRQYALDEDEAFTADGTTSAFNPIVLTDTLDDLKALPPQYRVGNFYWKEGVRDNPEGVEFIEEQNGRFKMVWEPEEHLRNLRKIRSGMWWPGNEDFMIGGIDPFDHKELTVEGERTMSKGAIRLIKMPSVSVPSDFDEGPVLYYTHRGPDPDFFYEECIMASVYYGCPVLIEDNKPGCIKYYQSRGYAGYLVWLPGRTKPGITNTAPSSGAGVNGEVAAHTSHFINHHCHTVKDPDQIREWIKFKVTETTKFDGSMAFGFAKIGQKAKNAGFARPQGEKLPNIKEILPDTMLSGGGRGFFD